MSRQSSYLIYPSKYLKSNHLNKNINMKFKQILIISISFFNQNAEYYFISTSRLI